MLYQDNKTITFAQTLYTYYFILRRFLTVSVLVFANKFPFFQSAIMTVLSMLNASYMFVTNPL